MRSSHALCGSRNHGVTKSDRQKRCVSSQKKGVKIEFSYIYIVIFKLLGTTTLFYKTVLFVGFSVQSSWMKFKKVLVSSFGPTF
jgi:hypothetical protein